VHERVLERTLAGARQQLGRGPRRDHAAMAEDHDAPAQRGDFLHHVRAEQQALALCAQLAQEIPQRTGAHDVEAVGRLVEQDRLRIVNERASDRDLHSFALRKSLRAPVGDGRDAERADQLADARIAIVVNPNNPDGRLIAKDALLALADRLRRRRGLLLVDEAFMEVGPEGASLSDHVEEGNIVVLRSFGKFYGLPGVRLSFALAAPTIVARLAAALGPWPVSGAAIEIGTAALADTAWREAARKALAEAAGRLDSLLAGAGLSTIGGTSLFRLVRIAEAERLFQSLGQAGILVRRFGEPIKPVSPTLYGGKL